MRSATTSDSSAAGGIGHDLFTPSRFSISPMPARSSSSSSRDHGDRHAERAFPPQRDRKGELCALKASPKPTIAAERGRFRACTRPRLRSVRTWLFWGIGAALTVYCLHRFGVLSKDFLHGVSKFHRGPWWRNSSRPRDSRPALFVKVMGATIAMAFPRHADGRALAFP